MRHDDGIDLPTAQLLYFIEEQRSTRYAMLLAGQALLYIELIQQPEQPVMATAGSAGKRGVDTTHDRRTGASLLRAGWRCHGTGMNFALSAMAGSMREREHFGLLPAAASTAATAGWKEIIVHSIWKGIPCDSFDVV